MHYYPTKNPHNDGLNTQQRESMQNKNVVLFHDFGLRSSPSSRKPKSQKSATSIVACASGGLAQAGAGGQYPSPPVPYVAWVLEMFASFFDFWFRVVPHHGRKCFIRCCMHHLFFLKGRFRSEVPGRRLVLPHSLLDLRALTRLTLVLTDETTAVVVIRHFV